MKTIKFAIWGTGRIAKSFAQAVNFCEGAELVAVLSRNERSAQNFAKEFSIEKTYTDPKEFVEDKDIDIVYIATPTSLHFENVKECFRGGKNVICEKAVCENYADTKTLCDMAKEKGLFFMEAMWMKCRPTFLKALEWYQSGKIGEIRFIKADFSNAVPFGGEDRLFKKELGASALLDLGIYPISLITAFLGEEVKAVHAHLMKGRTGADFNGAVLFEYENAAASTVFGYDIENHNNCVIVGEKGRIVFGDWFFCSCEVKLYDQNGVLLEESQIPNLCNGYEYEVNEVCDCLRRGKTESRLVPIADTLSVMKILDEIIMR